MVSCEKFGIDKKDAPEVKETTPSFKIKDHLEKEGDNIDIIFAEAEPRLIEKQEGSEVLKIPVINIINCKTGLKETLWMSGVSIRNAVWKFSANKDSLLDVKARIIAYEYDTPKYKKCIGYNVFERFIEEKEE